MEGQDNGVAEQIKHDLQSLLSCEDRDFLIRNNGDQVKIDSLKGKKVGLYFSASWCGPCQRFTPTLVEIYNELLPKGDFEVVFVSADKDAEEFNGYPDPEGTYISEGFPIELSGHLPFDLATNYDSQQFCHFVQRVSMDSSSTRPSKSQPQKDILHLSLSPSLSKFGAHQLPTSRVSETELSLFLIP